MDTTEKAGLVIMLIGLGIESSATSAPLEAAALMTLLSAIVFLLGFVLFMQ